MPFTLHVYTNAERTEFTSHTFDDALKAAYAVGHRDDLAADYPDIEKKLSYLVEPAPGEVRDDNTFHGFAIYDESGICIHTHNGENLGASLPA
jgi:hypothetical protein